MSDTIIQIVHDTLKDTVLIANAALNSVKDEKLPEYLTLIFSAASGLILFGFSLIKDLLLHKKKDRSDQNLFRFEKAHPKRTQIIEKCYTEFYVINNYLRLYNNHKSMFDEQLKNQYLISESFNRLSIITANLAYVLLYLDDDTNKIVRDLHENFSIIILTFMGKNGKEDVNIDDIIKKCSVFMEKLLTESKRYR